VVRPAALVLLLTSVLIAGCTKTGEATSGDRTVVTTTTLTPSRPPNAPSGPLPAGPTTAAADVGVRMGRVAVLSSAGKPVGCRFYADQDPQFKASEHLPGPNQPVLQIVSTRYTDPTAAHNGMVKLAEAGTNAHQDDLNSSTEAISYQVRFDPADAGQDWAYAFRKNTTVVVVTTAQRDTSFDARAVASAIVSRF
jgi:hypothetical protein